MKSCVSIPEVALIASTRVALGVGIGLLVANRMTGNQREATGWALLALGVMTTIPLALDVLGKHDAMNEKMFQGD